MMPGERVEEVGEVTHTPGKSIELRDRHRLNFPAADGGGVHWHARRTRLDADARVVLIARGRGSAGPIGLLVWGRV